MKSQGPLLTPQMNKFQTAFFASVNLHKALQEALSQRQLSTKDRSALALAVRELPHRLHGTNANHSLGKPTAYEEHESIAALLAKFIPGQRDPLLIQAIAHLLVHARIQSWRTKWKYLESLVALGPDATTAVLVELDKWMRSAVSKSTLEEGSKLVSALLLNALLLDGRSGTAHQRIAIPTFLSILQQYPTIQRITLETWWSMAPSLPSTEQYLIQQVVGRTLMVPTTSTVTADELSLSDIFTLQLLCYVHEHPVDASWILSTSLSRYPASAVPVVNVAVLGLIAAILVEHGSIITKEDTFKLIAIATEIVQQQPELPKHSRVLFRLLPAVLQAASTSDLTDTHVQGKLELLVSMCSTSGNPRSETSSPIMQRKELLQKPYIPDSVLYCLDSMEAGFEDGTIFGFGACLERLCTSQGEDMCLALDMISRHPILAQNPMLFMPMALYLFNVDDSPVVHSHLLHVALPTVATLTSEDSLVLGKVVKVYRHLIERGDAVLSSVALRGLFELWKLQKRVWNYLLNFLNSWVRKYRTGVVGDMELAVLTTIR